MNDDHIDLEGWRVYQDSVLSQTLVMVTATSNPEQRTCSWPGA